MKNIFLFPGQGSQYVGMGKELFENFSVAKDTFAEANEALAFDIQKLCFEGPEEELKLTKNTQPAILLVSIAALRVLRSETKIEANYTAGHSLGEYSALVASGCLDFSQALNVVHNRGKFMQEAVPAGTGAMAALIGASSESAREICEFANTQTNEVCEMANFNGGGQLVISGTKAAVQKAIEYALEKKELKIRKAVELPVSAPFHCSLMKTAADNLKPQLDALSVSNLEIPYIANVDASIVSEKQNVVENLYQQIFHSVLWEQSMETLNSLEISRAYEIGPGKVLSGLMRRINREIPVANIESADSIKSLLA